MTIVTISWACVDVCGCGVVWSWYEFAAATILLTPNYRSQGIHGTAKTEINAENNVRSERNFKETFFQNFAVDSLTFY